MNVRCIPVGPLQANCYFVWDDGRHACAIDPGAEADRLLRFSQDERLLLEGILVTHGHFDHVEGVSRLADATGTKIYCSALTAPILNGSAGCSATGLPVPSVTQAEIVIVADGDQLCFGDIPVGVIATPGHTPADITFDIEGQLFCGDLLFHGSVGRTDFPGGDFSQLLTSISRLVASYPPSARVYPGHMDASTLGEELAHNPFLAGLRRDG